ncbi:hypothetical protein [Streptomyces virginiae]|nr:hypothetical protein [Streptomyces virginiae]
MPDIPDGGIHRVGYGSPTRNSAATDSTRRSAPRAALAELGVDWAR